MYTYILNTCLQLFAYIVQVAIEKGFNSVRQDLMVVVSRIKTLEAKVDFVHDYIALQKNPVIFMKKAKIHWLWSSRIEKM